MPDSDIWWIRFKVDGVEHREKMVRRKKREGVRCRRWSNARLVMPALAKLPARRIDRLLPFGRPGQEDLAPA
jgi:hypothetical protein